MTRPVRTLQCLPLVRMLRSYERTFLRYDVVAGLVLATMLIPQ